LADKQELSLESEYELYDVMVRLRDGGDVDSLDPVALQAAGIPEKYVASLLKLLRAGQMAKVKGSSPKSRAVQVAERFVRAGLTVSVTPALNVQTLVHDDRVTCPACSEHVHLTEERKCPACGVYVDKITPALLRKRKKIARARERKAERDSRQKINAEDRMRMEAQAAIFRKHIRADLGGAYELVEVDHRRDRRLRMQRIAASLGAATVALVGGGLIALWVSSKGDWSLASQRFFEGLTGTASRDLPSSALATAGSANRVTLRSLALEGAVEQLAHPQAAVAAGTAGVAAHPIVGISMQRKMQLALATSRTLAEIGQLSKARDVLLSVKTTPELIGEPALAAEVRVQEIEIQALMLAATPASQFAAQLPRLQDALTAVADAGERAIALARAGAALGSKAHLIDTGRDLLSRAQTGLDAIKDAPSRAHAQAEWALAKAQLLAAEAQMSAASGATTRARTLASEIEALAPKTGNDANAATVGTQVRILALAWRAQRQAGAEADKAARTLAAAFATLEKIASPSERAAALRAVSPLLADGEARERVLAAATAAFEAAASLPAGERYGVMVDVSLAYAEVGAGNRAGELARQVFGAVAPQQVEATETAARLVIERELATLRELRNAAQFAEADAAAQKVIAYLR